uniref:Uncharacterized protein n=1 Tax=Anopheles atroparvus TaxID=41427 RepID=A0A182JLC9_ANOAO
MLVQWVVGRACSVMESSHCDQMPFGRVAQPQPWPQGRAQASDPFGSALSCTLFLMMATAASPFTLVVLCSMVCRFFRLADTSVLVAAVKENHRVSSVKHGSG